MIYQNEILTFTSEEPTPETPAEEGTEKDKEESTETEEDKEESTETEEDKEESTETEEEN